AAEALRRMAPDIAFAIDGLAIALADSDAVVRADSGTALAKIGIPSQQILLTALESQNLTVRRASIGGLAHLRPASTAVVAALIAALDDSQVGWDASRSLSQIGPAALPALIEAVRRPSSRVRALAIEALGDMKGDTSAAIPYVSDCLKDPDERVRAAAAV